EEIRLVLRHPGQVSQLGRSFSWTSARGPSSTRGVEVAVSVRAGRTRITVDESLGNLIGGVFGGMGGGLGGGGMGLVIPLSAAVLGAPALAVMVPLWLGSVYAGARVLYRRNVQRRQLELEGLMERLAALAQELTPGQPALRAGERRRLP
ncbi:MAG TPA: hypothetical protein VMT77_03020, partial [Gemmatimonadales bacterium]|nr:hypothetical protein [Gemmatimonadales bacterium]